MKPTIQVQLYSASGTHTTEIQPNDFPTRHVKTRLNPVDTEPLTITPNPDPELATGSTYQTTTAERTPETPKSNLKALLDEVDRCLNGKPEDEPTPETPEVDVDKNIVLKALRSRKKLMTIEDIERITGLNSLAILLECRALAEKGLVRIQSTLTCRKYEAKREVQ